MNTQALSVIPPELQAVLDRLHHPKTGVITELIEMSIQADEPPLYMFHAKCASPLFVDAKEYLLTEHHGDVLASGCSPERIQALWSTVGEAIERYACVCWPEFSDQFLVATANELGSDSIDIKKLILYQKEKYKVRGFPYQPIDLDLKYRWFMGKCLRTGKAKYIPNSMLWHGYVALSKEEKFCPQISTGLAAGQTIERAIDVGIREVIERDAFSTYWLTKQQPPSILLSERILSGLSEFSRHVISNRRFNVSLLWITNDVDVPVVLCTVEGVFNGGFALGAACDLNPIMAIEKSIQEAFHTWNWMLDMQRNRKPVPAREEVTQFSDHVRFYSKSENRESIQFLSGENVLDIPQSYFSDIDAPHASKVSTYVDRLYTNIGASSYFADMTPREFSKLGLFVGKVVCPGVQPLHCGFGNEHCDRRRLNKFANWAGTKDWKMNIEPHPFP